MYTINKLVGDAHVVLITSVYVFGINLWNVSKKK